MFYWKMLLLSTLCVVDHLWPLILCSLLSMLSTLVHWYQQCVTVHYVPRCMSCQKAIVVITGRVYCFHDNIYITLILLLWDLNTLWVVDHLWPLIYIYIYIYIFAWWPLTCVDLIFKMIERKCKKSCQRMRKCTKCHWWKKQHFHMTDFFKL